MLSWIGCTGIDWEGKLTCTVFVICEISYEGFLGVCVCVIIVYKMDIVYLDAHTSM